MLMVRRSIRGAARIAKIPPGSSGFDTTPVADLKSLKGGRKTIYQLRPHLSQMRTTKYMPFTRKKRYFDKNISQ